MKELQTFDYKENIKSLLNCDRRELQIIAGFWIVKGYKFENSQQAQQSIKRYIKEAKKLACYELKKVGDTMRWLDKNVDYKWTIETVSKYIDEDLCKLEKKLPEEKIRDRDREALKKMAKESERYQK